VLGSLLRQFQVSDWWWRMTTPSVASHVADVSQVSRSRLASLMLLCALAISLLLVPSLVADGMPFGATLLPVCCVALALVVNRLATRARLGAMIVALLEVTILAGMIAYPHDANISAWLLILPEFVAVSLISPGSVFLVAAVNTVMLFARQK